MATARLGCSLRSVARATGASLGTVRNLMRPELGLFGDDRLVPLGPVDVLCVRALVALGANRSTNRNAADLHTAALLERDRTAVALLRAAFTAGTLLPGARLLAIDELAWLVAKDHELLAALDEHPASQLLVLPVGQWAGDLLTGTAGTVPLTTSSAA